VTTVADKPVGGLAADALACVDALRAHAAGARVALALVEALEAAPPEGGELARSALEPRLKAHGLVWQDAALRGETHALEALGRQPIESEASTQAEVLLAMGLQGWLAAPGAEVEPVVGRWAAAAGWALRSLHLNPYRFLLAVLGPERGEVVFSALVAELAQSLGAATGQPDSPFGARAECVLRIEAVASALPPRLREPLLARLAAATDGPLSRRLLAGYVDAPPQGPPELPAARPRLPRQSAPLRIEGDTRPAPQRAFVAVLLGICGWTLLKSIWELIRRGLLKGRRRTSVELRGDLLRVRRSDSLLDRAATEEQQIVPVSALQGWGRERHAAPLLTLVGLAAFSLGGVAGLLVLFDSLQAGFPLFGLVGLLVVGLGVGLDLGLHLLVRRSLSRATVWIAPAGQPALRVGGLPSIEARRFVEELERAHQVLRSTR